MKKSIKRVLVVIGVIVVFIAIMIGGILIKTKQALDKQVNEKIDMTKVPDGIYAGESDGGLVQVEVEVEVKNHNIVNINLLKHECGKGKPAESMIDEMIKNNTDDVDCVSGATASGRTIRNAVNKALSKSYDSEQ